MASILPNISDLIGLIYNTAQPFFNAFLPFVWYFVAIAFVFIAAAFIIALIQRKFDDSEDFLYDIDRKHAFQELFGSRTGAMMAESSRLFNLLEKQDQKMILPRDFRSGQSPIDYLLDQQFGSHKAAGFGPMPWQRTLNPNDFRTYPFSFRPDRFGAWLGHKINENRTIRAKWQKAYEEANS